MTVFWGLITPFIGTTLGAACVFFIKGELKPLIQKGLLGFAAGVMVAASVWSLLIPAMEMSEDMGRMAFIPPVAGFLLGIAFLLLLDRIIPHLHIGCEESEGPKCSLKRSTMLVLAVVMHNIPEGISIFIPIYYGSKNKKKAFFYTFIAGFSEVLGAFIAWLFLSQFVNDYFFSFMFATTAGIMLYIAIYELLPEGLKFKNKRMLFFWFMVGMLVMLVSEFIL